MAQVENGDVLRIGAVMSFQAAYDIVNVWHVEVVNGGGIDFPQAGLDIQDMMDALYGNITAILSDLITPKHLTLSNVTQNLVFGAMAWGAWPGGSDTNEATAPGVCCLTWARTQRPRVQIRKYLGVFTEVWSVDGLWTTQVTSPCSDMMLYHIQDHTYSEGLQLQGVAYNRTLGSKAYGVSSAVSPEPAYQRRRKRGRGS